MLFLSRRLQVLAAVALALAIVRLADAPREAQPAPAGEVRGLLR